jgi:hypothetical protein
MQRGLHHADLAVCGHEQTLPACFDHYLVDAERLKVLAAAQSSQQSSHCEGEHAKPTGAWGEIQA